MPLSTIGLLPVAKFKAAAAAKVSAVAAAAGLTRTTATTIRTARAAVTAVVIPELGWILTVSAAAAATVLQSVRARATAGSAGIFPYRRFRLSHRRPHRRSMFHRSGQR